MHGDTPNDAADAWASVYANAQSMAHAWSEGSRTLEQIDTDAATLCAALAVLCDTLSAHAYSAAFNARAEAIASA